MLISVKTSYTLKLAYYRGLEHPLTHKMSNNHSDLACYGLWKEMNPEWCESVRPCPVGRSLAFKLGSNLFT